MIIGGSQSSYVGLKSLYGIAVSGSTVYGALVPVRVRHRVHAPHERGDATPTFIVGTVGDDSGTVITTDGTNLWYVLYRDNTAPPFSSGATGLWRADVAAEARRTSGPSAPSARWRSTRAISTRSTAERRGSQQGRRHAHRNVRWKRLRRRQRRRLRRLVELVNLVKSNDGCQTTSTTGMNNGSLGFLRGDPTYLYWFDSGSQTMWRATKSPVSGGSNVTPSSGVPALPSGMSYNAVIPDNTASTNWVFFFMGQLGVGGQVWREPKDGSAAAQKVADIGDGIGSVTRRTAIYFTTYGSDASGNPPRTPAS